MLKCTYVFKVPDDGTRRPKHVVLRDMTLMCYTGRHIFVYDSTAVLSYYVAV